MLENVQLATVKISESILLEFQNNKRNFHLLYRSLKIVN